MLMLNLSSSMQKQLRMIERKDYSNFFEYLQVDHTEINNKVLGVIGYGHIGQKVIQIAKALDMKILVNTRTPHQDSEHVKFVDLETLLKKSDYISLHCPLNEFTYHMINQEALSLMKSTAYIINTSRGSLIDEQALIKSLKNHEIAGAGLDVQEHEPDINKELFELENCIVTPHMGWRGVETRQRLLSLIKKDIEAYLSNNPINVVS